MNSAHATAQPSRGGEPQLLTEASVVRAATRSGEAASTTSAVKIAPMVARVAVVPSTLRNDQTPVPLSSLPVATVIAESIAVLMVQKMTISGSFAQRGAEGRVATADTTGARGVATSAEAPPSAASTTKRRVMV